MVHTQAGGGDAHREVGRVALLLSLVPARSVVQGCLPLARHCLVHVAHSNPQEDDQVEQHHYCGPDHVSASVNCRYC